MDFFSRYRIPLFFLIAVFIAGGTYLLIHLARGYRFDPIIGKIKANGLLAANSTPKGAQVIIDGELATATDTTIALPPGQYQVTIRDNGFHDWQKQLVIEKELVTQTGAYLFSLLPVLEPITFNGVLNPIISPDNSRIVYTVSQPVSQAGLWLIELGGNLLDLNRSPKQLAKSDSNINFTQTDYYWTNDGRWIVVKPKSSPASLLIDPNKISQIVSLIDQTKQIEASQKTWAAEQKIKESSGWRKIPPPLAKILKENADRINFNSDGLKISYQATASATIPDKIIPPVVAASSQAQDRNLRPGNYYVYDLREDRNFKLPFNETPITPTPTKAKNLKSNQAEVRPFQPDNFPRWLNTAKHLFWVEKTSNGDTITVCEYDGTNKINLFSGYFVPTFVHTGPGHNKLVILTRLGGEAEKTENLYLLNYNP